jgi:hypothetical protein
MDKLWKQFPENLYDYIHDRLGSHLKLWGYESHAPLTHSHKFPIEALKI